MALFGFKKKQEQLDLPPPPAPEEGLEAPPEPMMEEPEIPPVTAPEESAEAPMAMQAPAMERKPDKGGPLFVSVQDYQAVLSGVNAMRAKLGEVEESFRKLNEIKANQEKELDEWRTTLEDVQRKLTYVDEVLFGK